MNKRKREITAAVNSPAPVNGQAVEARGLRKGRSWWALAIAALALIFVLVLAGCGAVRPGEEPGREVEANGRLEGSRAQMQRPAAGIEGDGTHGQQAGETVFAVATVKAALGPIADTLELGGEVVAETRVNAFADIGGKIAILYVEVGDRVGKDQVLAEVDPSGPGRQHAASPVKAPITGTVTAVLVRVGTTVSINTPLATIGELEALEIETHVPERFIGRVGLDTPALLTFAAFPDEGFNARVSEMDPVVDPASRTLQIKLVLDRSDGRIKAGMFATVELVTEQKAAVVKIPAECVLTQEGRSLVYVVEGEHAGERPVDLGIGAGGMVEITQGLESGEEVVISGQNLLVHGSRVRIVGGGV